MDVLDGVAENCVDVATAVMLVECTEARLEDRTEIRLVDCMEVPRLEKDKEATVSIVPEEMAVVKEELSAVD